MALTPRTATVTIYTGDYLDRLRHLERRHEAAVDAEESGPPRTNDEIPESVRIAEEHAALKAEAEAEALHVKLTTVRRSVYRKLADEHPPREGDKGDQALGVNALTFREVLVPAAITEVRQGDETRDWLADFSDAEREEFLDLLAESDVERLFGQAFGLVNGFTADPKGLPVSRSTQ